MGTPISRAGYEKLREEIRVLEEEEIPRVTELVAEARAEGDLKENAEYHGQREALAHLQRQVAIKKQQLSGSTIVDKSTLPKDEVHFGSRVTVRDLADGLEEKYEFVGPGEEDYMGEVMKVLTNNPLAEALVGKKVGDKVEVDAPAGILNLEIVAIEDPDEE